MTKTTKTKKNLLPLLILVIVVVGLFGYWMLKNWVNNQIALAYSECKNVVSQQIYAEMNAYKKDKEGIIVDPSAIAPLLNSKNKLARCVIEKTSNKFSFLGQDSVRTIKARLELEYGL